MVNRQPSLAAAQRAATSGYEDPTQRWDCCARCVSSEVRGRVMFCTLHRHRVHKMGICKDIT